MDRRAFLTLTLALLAIGGRPRPPAVEALAVARDGDEPGRRAWAEMIDPAQILPREGPLIGDVPPPRILE